MKSFASDNWSGIHPKAIEAITKANVEHEPAYCEDSISKEAYAIFRKEFGEQAEIFYAFNGTGANVVGLNTITRSYNSIICADTAHIITDECGAPMKQLGCTFIPVKNEDGKITPEAVKKHIKGFGEVHHAQPKVISITQSTELGTVYTTDEIKALADLAHQHDMYLHVDGSRMANAAVSLGKTFRQICTETGVDVLSFGGTKNGMLMGETVIFINPECSKDTKYIRKQDTQLFSKMRFISAQYISYLQDGWWKENAAHANNMASLLAKELSEIQEVSISYPVQANVVFAKLPMHAIKKAQEQYPFYIWDEDELEVRLMCSYDTTPDDINGLVKIIKEELQG